MTKWEKLNKEFDDALDSMTSEDWNSWHERFKQKQKNQNKMTRSPILKDLLQEMQTDAWHIKARRWCKMRLWKWSARTRFIWDLNYKGNIFKRK